MKTIAIVIGTRPEGIKLAPIIQKMREEAPTLKPLVIATGQHQAILKDVFSVFDIQPDITLSIDRSKTTLSALQAQLMVALEDVYIKEAPDIVMVQGDTTSALAGAMAGYYQNIPIAYVESGLRSGNLQEPFPEEANRRLITQLAKWHFTPTKMATKALFEEGIRHNVHQVGNTVIDALLVAKHQLINGLKASHDWIKIPKKNDRIMVLVTLHRRENWGEGLQNMIDAIHQLVALHHTLDVVWLTHPNPKVKHVVEAAFEHTKQVYVYPPANYIELVQLMDAATLIVTDSGGIQEEAPSLNKPVLVARQVTERMEGVDAGCAVLVGTNPASVIQWVNRLLASSDDYTRMASQPNPYGDGDASQKVIRILST